MEANRLIAQLGIGPNSNSSGNLVPLSAGVAYEDSPTISYTPLGGEAFLARATRLGLHGLSLDSPQSVTVGKRLRLKIFLQGESFDVAGHVVAVGSTPSPGQPTEAEIAFDPLGEEQTLLLEGCILAHRTNPRTSRS